MASKLVGFIGVGLMGHGMAKNILEKGFDLLVMAHRNRAPVDDLLARGAREAASPREIAAAADFIVLCVTGSPQVEALVRGADGILAGARPGLIVIDSSTSDPVSTAALAQELAGVGAALVDAPLSRTPKEAEAGTLDCMVGGDHAAFEAALPVIQCFAAKIVHVGPPGAGHTMKLLNNFVSIGYAALYSEALALGAKSGIMPAAFHAVIGGGRMSCGFYDTFMKYVVERDRDAHKFTIANAHKDMRYLANLANSAGVASLLGSTVKGYLSTAEATGKGGDYLPMLSDHVAALNGVSLTPATG
ncbi:MAG: NAD(P)-dependent oxidoreductase [Rhizobiales bacterium]|nr:NAD(P)-dependent oxidoreductase [Hyphomicrobiales bacterium]